MDPKSTKLAREQLDRGFERYRNLVELPPPRLGWIRAIRNALGMSAKQLARRSHLSQQRIAAIEKQELDGSLTLRTLRKVAEGLDCKLVFSLLPRTSLESMHHRQVEQLVQRRLARSGHLMDLENQGLSETERKRVALEMIKELAEKPPAILWSED
jgi:predicted DNA-binding mobile mystery protein A